MAELIASNPQTAILDGQNSITYNRQLYEVVESLPTQNIKTTVIYLVPAENPSQDNEYDKWIYVNDAWETLGSGVIDLSDYYTKEETNSLLEDKENSKLIVKATFNYREIGPGKWGFVITLDKTAKEIFDNKNNNIIVVGDADDNYNYNCYFEGIYYNEADGYTFLIRAIQANNDGVIPVEVNYYLSDALQENEYPTLYLDPYKRCGLPSMDDSGEGLKYYYPKNQVYTKTEIDNKGFLTLETLPIYDGTVV